jgi:hypothetical protein
MKLTAFVLALVVLPTAAVTQTNDARQGVVEKWYTALGSADQAAIDGLLGEAARIELQDLDIVQTKAEFMESMDSWSEAAVGLELRYRIVAEDAAMIETLACYDFPDNDILMQEQFVIADGKVTGSVQKTVAEDCSTF